ncbi:hypothetical protein D3C87_1805110 [compost metagenome]
MGSMPLTSTTVDAGGSPGKNSLRTRLYWGKWSRFLKYCTSLNTSDIWPPAASMVWRTRSSTYQLCARMGPSLMSLLNSPVRPISVAASSGMST